MSIEQEMAIEFVKKYPNQFTEDQWFWENEIKTLLEKYKKEN